MCVYICICIHRYTYLIYNCMNICPIDFNYSQPECFNHMTIFDKAGCIWAFTSFCYVVNSGITLVDHQL